MQFFTSLYSYFSYYVLDQIDGDTIVFAALLSIGFILIQTLVLHLFVQQFEKKISLKNSFAVSTWIGATALLLTIIMFGSYYTASYASDSVICTLLAGAITAVVGTRVLRKFTPLSFRKAALVVIITTSISYIIEMVLLYSLA